MLLLVPLSDGKLVVAYVAALEGNQVGVDACLELFVLVLKTSLQTSHDLVLLSIQF